ncbi:MAG: exodeoxyribonuclease VII small subunit [Bacterioplanes sp.]|nr:exodeoxyribonuclease VII small subunit [Bacterioplanes sp.]
MTDQPAFEFEQALQQLETLVQQMEEGNLTLEQSLQAFEQGVGLTRQCQQALTQAEQRVHVLLEQNGQSVAQPFVASERT